MRFRLLVFLSVVSLASFALGCGGGETSNGSEDGQAEADASAAPAGTAAISGTVHFEGTPPERQPLDLNRECMELRDEPPLSQTVVVNDNETLRWVFVYVKEGLEGETFPVSNEPVVFDQEGCVYTPHVFGLQAGQTLEIHNSDPFQHNIHALPEENRPFNFSQPVQGMTRETTFKVSEVMVPIKCDVHGWMQAYAGVVPHPFHSTTQEDGTYNLENLPAGEYVIEAWHEEYGTQTQSVTIEEDATETVDFTFQATAAS